MGHGLSYVLLVGGAWVELRALGRLVGHGLSYLLSGGWWGMG